jgi:hypothetical protein
MLLVTLGILAACMLGFAHRRFGTLSSSPVQLVAVGLLALGSLGWVFYDDVAGTSGAAGIKIYLAEAERRQALTLILQFTVALLVGAAALSLVMKRDLTSPSLRTSVLAIPERATRLALVASPLPLLLIVWAQGRNLWERSFYVDHLSGNLLAAAGSSVGIGAVAILGYLWGKNRARIYVALVVLGYAAAFFGAGSRRLALIPVLFAVGNAVAAPGRRAQITLIASGVAGLYLLYLPLALRSGSSHGIAPYWSRLPEVAADGSSLAVTALNLLIGFAIIQRTAFAEAPIPDADMWISINPLPGSLAGWGEVALDHRLNLYTPYAGLGEIGNAGLWWVCGLGVGIGIILGLLDRRVDQHLARGQHAVGLLIVGLSAVFLLFMTQYTLRASMRMLVYAFALSLAASWWSKRPKGSPDELRAGKRRTTTSPRG